MTPKSSFSAGIRVGPERRLSKRGTIIPMVVRFDNGVQLLSYHTAEDAAFAPTASERSPDDGFTWTEIPSPLHRLAAVASLGDRSALFLDQYLLQTSPGEYAVLTNRTTDCGATFEGVSIATFRAPQLLPRPYLPLPESDPKYWSLRRPPAAYDPILRDRPPILGGFLFGRAIRLPDGALGLAVYGSLPTSPLRPRSETEGQGIAEADLPRYNAVIFCRSNDEGRNWDAISVIADPRPGLPYSLGDTYSEGFNETALAVTADGNLLAICRHGSYHLLWQTVSRDLGKTWAPMTPMNFPGVAPCLATLPDGVLAAAWGRPGLTIAFSLDGLGRDWHLLSSIFADDVGSQKYPWLVPLGANTLLLVYDRRDWDARSHRFVKHGIYARTVFLDA